MSANNPHLTVYTKLNEAIEVINAQSRYIREIDSLFRTIANDTSLGGKMTRRLLHKYVQHSAAPSITGIKPIDIPPFVPGTLEVKTNGHKSSLLDL